MAMDGDRWSPLWLEEKLDAVAGIEFGVSRPDVDSDTSVLGMDTPLGRALEGAGLVRTGVRALRKSVYATGGVMGVWRLSSCLTTAETQLMGLAVATISEGKEADCGVCKGGRTGFLVGIVTGRKYDSPCLRMRW